MSREAIPSWAVKLIERRGGVVRFRSMMKDGKRYTIAVTARPGPRGGRTIIWEKPKGRRSRPQ